MLGPSSSSNADQWGVHQKTINHALTAQICSTNWLTLALWKYSLANDWLKVKKLFLEYFVLCFWERIKSDTKDILLLWFIDSVSTSLCLVVKIIQKRQQLQTSGEKKLSKELLLVLNILCEIINKMFYLTSNITADIYLQVIEKDILNSPEIEIIFFKGNKNCSEVELWTKFRFPFKNRIFFIPPSIPESCECKFTFPMPQNSYLFPRWKNFGRNVEPCPDVAQTKLFAPWQVIWSYDRAFRRHREMCLKIC